MISIIIPCYNSEKYIEECISSCINQTYKSIEIICIDNNSSDKTWYLLQNLQKKFKQIRICQEKETGAPYARNKGISLSKGEWIQFLDSDDILTPNKLSSQIDFATKENCDIVVSDYIRYDSNLKNVIRRHTFKEITYDPINTCIAKILITGNPIYRRRLFDDFGNWDTTLTCAQDWEINLRFALKSIKFGYLPGDFLMSRTVTNSLSSNWQKVSCQASKIIIQYSSVLAKHHLNSKALSKIVHTHYESLKFTEDKKTYFNIKQNLMQFYKSSLTYLNTKRRVLILIFGITQGIKIEKIIDKIRSK